MVHELEGYKKKKWHQEPKKSSKVENLEQNKCYKEPGETLDKNVKIKGSRKLETNKDLCSKSKIVSTLNKVKKQNFIQNNLKKTPKTKEIKRDEVIYKEPRKVNQVKKINSSYKTKGVDSPENLGNDVKVKFCEDYVDETKTTVDVRSRDKRLLKDKSLYLPSRKTTQSNDQVKIDQVYGKKNKNKN